MINIALRKLRNDLIDYRNQVEQLKRSLIETNKIKICDEHFESVNSKKNSLKLQEIKANKD